MSLQIRSNQAKIIRVGKGDIGVVPQLVANRPSLILQIQKDRVEHHKKYGETSRLLAQTLTVLNSDFVGFILKSALLWQEQEQEQEQERFTSLHFRAVNECTATAGAVSTTGHYNTRHPVLVMYSNCCSQFIAISTLFLRGPLADPTSSTSES